MITIKNVRNLIGDVETLRVPGDRDEIIDAAGHWTIMPALIDISVNESIDWSKEAFHAISGGITTVFGLLKSSAIQSPTELMAIDEAIHSQLHAVRLPLHFHYYFELGLNSLSGFGKLKPHIAAIKIPTGYNQNGNYLDRVFQLAAQEDCLVVYVCDPKSPRKTHQMIELVEKYSTQLLMMNISDQVEIDFLKEAKKSEILVHSATSASMLSSKEFLWGAITDKTIDIVTSGASAEGCESLLPTMLNGYHAKKISLEEIVSVTRTNAERIFRLNYNNDVVLVDLELSKTDSQGHALMGWPCYTLLNGIAYPIQNKVSK